MSEGFRVKGLVKDSKGKLAPGHSFMSASMGFRAYWVAAKRPGNSKYYYKETPLLTMYTYSGKLVHVP